MAEETILASRAEQAAYRAVRAAQPREGVTGPSAPTTARRSNRRTGGPPMVITHDEIPTITIVMDTPRQYVPRERARTARGVYVFTPAEGACPLAEQAHRPGALWRGAQAAPIGDPPPVRLTKAQRRKLRARKAAAKRQALEAAATMA